MRISIPNQIQLTCAACKAQFTIASRYLHGRSLVYCPLCREPVSIYDSLPSRQRRQIYHAIRDVIEKRVYDEQQLEQPDYFEDVNNLPDSTSLQKS